MSSRDTIVAAATGVIRSGVAVVRIAGDNALVIVKKLSGKETFVPRLAEFCVVDTGEIRDEAIVIFFEAPRSYTGENVAEIHCHGNPLIVSEIIKFAVKNGARLAEAGEFTKRAFLNGKTDLTGAEAVCDIINAETKLQLKSAEQLREGRLFAEIKGYQDEIYDLIAELNAAIDYPEEDIEETTAIVAALRAGEILKKLKKLAATFENGRLIRDGVRVAIFGAPNVGKSSLLNSILGKNRAIVSNIPGTTRDTVEDRFEYGGMMFVIVDTAGIRKTTQAIEKLGIDRALDAVKNSDIVLSVCERCDGWLPLETDKPIIFVKNKCDLTGFADSVNEKDIGKGGNTFTECDLDSNKTLKNSKKIAADGDIIDNGEIKANGQIKDYIVKGDDYIEVSALYNTNIDALKQMIFDKACGGLSGELVLTNLRHFDCISAAADYLNSVTVLAENESPEIISLDLVAAADELGRITGLIGSDEIIARIFSKFCVGK